MTNETKVIAFSRTNINALKAAATQAMSEGDLFGMMERTAQMGRAFDARNAKFESMMTGEYVTPTALKEILHKSYGFEFAPPQINNFLIELNLQVRRTTPNGNHYFITDFCADLGAGQNITMGKAHSVRWDVGVAEMIADRVTDGDVNA